MQSPPASSSPAAVFLDYVEAVEPTLRVAGSNAEKMNIVDGVIAQILAIMRRRALRSPARTAYPAEAFRRRKKIRTVFFLCTIIIRLNALLSSCFLKPCHSTH